MEGTQETGEARGRAKPIRKSVVASKKQQHALRKEKTGDMESEFWLTAHALMRRAYE